MMILENLYELIINNSNKNRLLKEEDVSNYNFDCKLQFL